MAETKVADIEAILHRAVDAATAAVPDGVTVVVLAGHTGRGGLELLLSSNTADEVADALMMAWLRERAGYDDGDGDEAPPWTHQAPPAVN